MSIATQRTDIPVKINQSSMTPSSMCSLPGHSTTWTCDSSSDSTHRHLRAPREGQRLDEMHDRGPATKSRETGFRVYDRLRDSGPDRPADGSSAQAVDHATPGRDRAHRDRVRRSPSACGQSRVSGQCLRVSAFELRVRCRPGSLRDTGYSRVPARYAGAARARDLRDFEPQAASGLPRAAAGGGTFHRQPAKRLVADATLCRTRGAGDRLVDSPRNGSSARHGLRRSHLLLVAQRVATLPAPRNRRPPRFRGSRSDRRHAVLAPVGIRTGGGAGGCPVAAGAIAAPHLLLASRGAPAPAREAGCVVFLPSRLSGHWAFSCRVSF